MPSLFEIVSLTPLGDLDLWSAKIAIRTTEQVDHIGIGHEALLTVRFQFSPSGTAGDLMETALTKAEALLGEAAAFVKDRTALEMLATPPE